MADSRGFKPINQLWQSATDQDSECLYEEIPGRSQDTDRPAGAAVGQQGEEEEQLEEEENVGGSRRSLDFGVQVGDSSDFWAREEIVVARSGTIPRSRTDGGARSRSGSADRRPSDRARQRDVVIVRVEEDRYAARRSHVEPGTGAVLPPPAATGHKLTRGRASASNTVARYLHSASTNASAAHYHHHGHHHGQHGQYPPGGRTTGRQHRHHHSSRGSYSNETQEEVQEDDEATLRELLVRYVLRTRVDDESSSPSSLGPLSRTVGYRVIGTTSDYYTTPSSSGGRRIVVRSFVDFPISEPFGHETERIFFSLVLKSESINPVMLSHCFLTIGKRKVLCYAQE